MTATKLVEIRQARTSLEIQDMQTILDAAFAAGIPYPHGCRSGRCGSCKSRLIEGAVELLQHSRFALTDEEKNDGFILACRALPQTDVTVAWLGSDDAVVPPPQRLNGIVTCLDDLTHWSGLRLRAVLLCCLPRASMRRLTSVGFLTAAIPWPITLAMMVWNFTFVIFPAALPRSMCTVR